MEPSPEAQSSQRCAWYRDINKAVKIVVVVIIINLIILAGLLFAMIYFIAAKKICIYENPSRADESS